MAITAAADVDSASYPNTGADQPEQDHAARANAVGGRATEAPRSAPRRRQEETGRRGKAGRIEDARREGRQSAIRRREQGGQTGTSRSGQVKAR
jgi:hypothetical protein